MKHKNTCLIKYEQCHTTQLKIFVIDIPKQGLAARLHQSFFLFWYDTDESHIRSTNKMIGSAQQSHVVLVNNKVGVDFTTKNL